MFMLGAIGQSARSVDRATLLDLLVAQQSVDRAAISRSRNNRLIAQQSVDGATIGRLRNIRQRTCAINRSGHCGNGSARLADCAGMFFLGAADYAGMVLINEIKYFYNF